MSENLYKIGHDDDYLPNWDDAEFICWSEIGKPTAIFEEPYWSGGDFHLRGFIGPNLDAFRGFLLDKMHVNDEGEEYGKYRNEPAKKHREWRLYFYEKKNGERISRTEYEKFPGRYPGVKKIRFFRLEMFKREIAKINDPKLAELAEKCFENTNSVDLVIDERDTEAIRQILEGCIRPHTVSGLIQYTGKGRPLYEYRDIIARIASTHKMRNGDVYIERTFLFVRQISLGKISGKRQMNLACLTHFLTSNWELNEYFSATVDDRERWQSYLMCLVAHTFGRLFSDKALRTYTPLSEDEMYFYGVLPLPRGTEEYLDYGGLSPIFTDGQIDYAIVKSEHLVRDELGDLVPYHTLFVKHYLLSKFLDRWIVLVKNAIKDKDIVKECRGDIATWSAVIAAVLKHDLCPNVPKCDKISWFSEYVTEENQKYFQKKAYELVSKNDVLEHDVFWNLMKPEYIVWGVEEFLEPCKNIYALNEMKKEFMKSVRKIKKTS